MDPGPERVVPPKGGDDEAYREYGRQLAMDGLLQDHYESGAGRRATGRRPAGSAAPWLRGIAAAAALVIVGFLLWAGIRHTPPRAPVVTRKPPAVVKEPEAPVEPTPPPPPPWPVPETAPPATVPPPPPPPLVPPPPRPPEPEPTARPAPAEMARVEASSGPGAERCPIGTETWTAAAEGTPILGGDRLRSGRARLRLRLVGGNTLWLDREGAVRFSAGEPLIELESGTAVFSGSGRPGAWVFLAPGLRVRDSGGAFAMHVEGGRGSLEETLDAKALAWAAELGLKLAEPAAPSSTVKAPTPEPPRPAFRTGRFGGTLAAAPACRYVIDVPAKVREGDRLGLILQFHGLRGHETHLMDGLVNGLRGQGLGDGFIVAGVKSQGDGWDAAADDGNVLKLVAWLRETYPVDPRLVFTAGVSFGAWMAGRFGTDHADLVTGVVSAAGYGWKFSKSPNPADPRPEFIFFTGDRDEDIEQPRRARTELRARGYSCVYREIDGTPHEGVWNHPAVMPEAAAWIGFVSRRRTAPKGEGLADLIRVAGGPAPGPRMEAIAALGPWARWRYDEARAVLLRTALSARVPEERAAATQALASAVRVDLLGAFEDRDLEQALLKLCDDDNDAVRAAAFAPFERLVEGSFGYRPDAPKPERWLALARWAAWLQERSPR